MATATLGFIQSFSTLPNLTTVLTEVVPLPDVGTRVQICALAYAGTIVACGLVDFFVIRRVLSKYPKAQYFGLHTLFNAAIVAFCMPDFCYAMLHPSEAMTSTPFALGSVVTTTAIGAFHTYHMLLTARVFGGSGLSREDFLHHTISGVAVPACGLVFPFGLILGIVNFSMCGFPGGVNYSALTCVKLGYMDSLRQKRLDCGLNLVIRMPLMLLALYQMALGLISGEVLPLSGSNSSYQNHLSLAAMLVAGSLHGFNAVYYCDKVVGNYHVRAAQAKMKTTTAAAAATAEGAVPASNKVKDK